MTSENITIANVIDIFKDFLEESVYLDIMEDSKMGKVLITDVSYSYDRSELLADKLSSPESLARYLLRYETASYYYPLDDADPWDTDEQIQNHVLMRLMPRLQKLPREWWNEVDYFFTEPKEGTDRTFLF